MTTAIRRILYVEDESDIRAVVEISLELIGGFTLEVCSSGREALDKPPAVASAHPRSASGNLTDAARIARGSQPHPGISGHDLYGSSSPQVGIKPAWRLNAK